MSLIFEVIIFSERGCQERRFVCLICGLDSEVEQLKTKLASVNSQLSYLKTVLGVETSCASINLWCAILFFLCSVLGGLCFEVFCGILFGDAALIKC